MIIALHEVGTSCIPVYIFMALAIGICELSDFAVTVGRVTKKNV